MQTDEMQHYVASGMSLHLSVYQYIALSLKIKSALKSTGRPLKSLEKSLNSIFCRALHS